MAEIDIRWKQRFQNYRKALSQLSEAVALKRRRPLSNIERQGMVKAFEFTHELAWNVMKDYFIYKGAGRIIGSRDATREAFQNQLIEDGDSWMDMIKTRNLAVHTYGEELVSEVVRMTVEVYYPLFVEFETVMAGLLNE